MPSVSLSVPPSVSNSSAIADEIRASGARATPVRIRALSLLRGAAAPVSHAEMEAAIKEAFGADSLDRVTLYRVLDWLVAAGFANKTVDAQRLTRFAPVTQGAHGDHTHFRCDGCGRVVCLDSPLPAPPSLPEGFRLAGVAVDVHGYCDHCPENRKS
jgi:Fur family transcriptional regulator, ferric uptake regulator